MSDIAKVQQDVITRVEAIHQEVPLLAKQLFQKELNGAVPSAYVKKEKGGFLTLPISYVEAMLDAYYLGEWQVTDFKWQVIANEVVGSLNLTVTNPITGKDKTVTGVAAVQIMVNKGSDPNLIENKKRNALETGFPKLEAMALKNAAKKLGKRFGRELNRNHRSESLEIIKEDRPIDKL